MKIMVILGALMLTPACQDSYIKDADGASVDISPSNLSGNSVSVGPIK